jgi:hypothetical protein
MLKQYLLLSVSRPSLFRFFRTSSVDSVARQKYCFGGCSPWRVQLLEWPDGLGQVRRCGCRTSNYLIVTRMRTKPTAYLSLNLGGFIVHCIVVLMNLVTISIVLNRRRLEANYVSELICGLL